MWMLKWLRKSFSLQVDVFARKKGRTKRTWIGVSKDRYEKVQPIWRLGLDRLEWQNIFIYLTPTWFGQGFYDDNESVSFCNATRLSFQICGAYVIIRQWELQLVWLFPECCLPHNPAFSLLTRATNWEKFVDRSSKMCSTCISSSLDQHFKFLLRQMSLCWMCFFKVSPSQTGKRTVIKWWCFMRTTNILGCNGFMDGFRYISLIFSEHNL